VRFEYRAKLLSDRLAKERKYINDMKEEGTVAITVNTNTTNTSTTNVTTFTTVTTTTIVTTTITNDNNTRNKKEDGIRCEIKASKSIIQL